MANWPASLPQNQFLGCADQDEESRLITQMDIGPAIIRNRFTANVRNVNVPIILNGTQKQTFDTFCRTTLANYSLSFFWGDPVTDSSVEFRFKTKPQFTMTRGGSTAERIWRGSMELEILP